MYSQIGIWGFGKEGQAAYNFLKRKYPEAVFTIITDTETNEVLPEVHLVTTQSSEKISSGFFGLIVRSPGISIYKETLVAAEKNDTVVTTNTNLWFETYPDAQTIVVTGTKGKSTTTNLTYHILQSAGYDVVLAGNIGTPLLEVTPGKDATVIELSSYQLADFVHHPTVAVVTNLLPAQAHIPWHNNSEQQYYADKMRLTQLATHLVVPIDNKRVQQYVHKPVRTFSSKSVAHYKNIFPLRGDHNLKNLAASLTAITALGLSIENLEKHIASYTQLPHRLEEVATVRGVTYVNDSIATLPEAVIEALNAYDDKEVTLIVGGQDNGADYTPLASHLSKQHIITIPDSGAKIAGLLKTHGHQVTEASSLQEAVHIAHSITPVGGVVLLSPGSPSFDHFKNFEDRGNQFKEAVHAL